MEKIDTNPHKYVVFDVETNGLNPKKDDLLSFLISSGSFTKRPIKNI